MAIVLIEVEALDVLYRAFLAAHELIAALDLQGQEDGGSLVVLAANTTVSETDLAAIVTEAVQWACDR